MGVKKARVVAKRQFLLELCQILANFGEMKQRSLDSRQNSADMAIIGYTCLIPIDSPWSQLSIHIGHIGVS